MSLQQKFLLLDPLIMSFFGIHLRFAKIFMFPNLPIAELRLQLLTMLMQLSGINKQPHETQPHVYNLQKYLQVKKF